jgi:hypothetical protein
MLGFRIVTGMLLATFANISVSVSTVRSVPPTSQPTTGPSTVPSSTVPEQVAGNWVEGSISPTTFWDIRTGAFVGNARGMGQYLSLNSDGTYQQYVYIEMRAYNMVTQVWTQHDGTVSFADDTFTIRPTKGHYRTAGTRKIDRPMSDKELADKVTTYTWRIETDDKGQETLVLPFEDGSSFRLRRAG